MSKAQDSRSPATHLERLTQQRNFQAKALNVISLLTTHTCNIPQEDTSYYIVSHACLFVRACLPVFRPHARTQLTRQRLETRPLLTTQHASLDAEGRR